MHNIVESGKAFYWGTSEWPAGDILAAIEIAERHHLHKPVMEQSQYNLFHRERLEVEYTRLFSDYGYGMTTWSPLASGLLTGKYNKGIPADSRGAVKGYEWLKEQLTDEGALAKVRALQPIADELGVTMAQLAIAWATKNPNVSSVITGASRVAQVQENMKAIEVAEKLTSEIMARIDAIAPVAMQAE
jgi:aryl-alcohol dehydrogenase-like predicted oxidoreductase